MLESKWNKITEGLTRYQETNKNYSQLLCEYLIVAEDHRFWSHSGFDIISLIMAIWKTKFHKKREGGSTVAMQLVRTITEDYKPNFQRKFSEIYLASKTTSVYKKDAILNCYLSIAYFGWNMHGIDQACNKLGFNFNNLTKYESASLIARLKYPEPRFFSNRQNNLIKHRAFHIINRHEKLESHKFYGTVFSAKRVKKAHCRIS